MRKVKNRIILFLGVCVCFAAPITGCDKKEEKKEPASETSAIEFIEEDNKEENTPYEDAAGENVSEENVTDEIIPGENVSDETEDGAETDVFRDYGPDIEADVNTAIASASTLGDEIDKIQGVTAKYGLIAAKAETQAEMNMMSGLTYTIWDKELNSLWSRISDLADEQTKERLLAGQRNWNSMKEEVKLESIGRPEDGGSMYPMTENAFYETITFNRCCILANELAKIKGESYNMPPRSMYATYVDDQGKGEVYSSLITRTGMELDNEAVISIYRLGGTEGTFSDKGNGVYEFISYSENVKGIIRMNGWDGATFEITECTDSPFNAGDVYEFDFAF